MTGPKTLISGANEQAGREQVSSNQNPALSQIQSAIDSSSSLRFSRSQLADGSLSRMAASLGYDLVLSVDLQQPSFVEVSFRKIGTPAPSAPLMFTRRPSLSATVPIQSAPEPSIHSVPSKSNPSSKSNSSSKPKQDKSAPLATFSSPLSLTEQAKWIEVLDKYGFALTKNAAFFSLISNLSDVSVNDEEKLALCRSTIPTPAWRKGNNEYNYNQFYAYMAGIITISSSISDYVFSALNSDYNIIYDQALAHGLSPEILDIPANSREVRAAIRNSQPTH